MGCVSLVQAVKDRENKFTNIFQQWNKRISEIGGNICCIDTDLVTQQMPTDKIILIVYYIYVHLQVSIAFAAIVVVLYKNIDEI